MKRLLLVSFLVSPLFLSAQTIIINRVELQGDKVLVFYDLNTPNQNQQFILNLYSSRDGFVTPLTNVTGDVGAEIRAGVDKRMEWSIMEEYGRFQGKIALEVRGRVYTPFVQSGSLQTSPSYKRGKVYNITWVPGGNAPVNFELYRGNTRISGNMNQQNDGDYTLNIPVTLKPGKDYRLKVTNAQSSDESFFTPYFHIKPKVSPLVKFGLPLVVVGGVAAFLGGGGSGGGDGGGGGNGGGGNGSTEIPLPPLPE